MTWPWKLHDELVEHKIEACAGIGVKRVAEKDGRLFK